MDSWQFEPARDLGMPMGERLRSARREPGLLGKIGSRVYSTLVATQLRLLQKLTVEGAHLLPTAPPFILAANHCSHLDVLVLATVLPPALRGSVFPVAAGDTFFKTPLKAALSAGFINALPMWRRNGGRHAVDDLRSRLTQEPCGLILFPEGTRSRTGQMSPFKPGLGLLVAGTTVPIYPCHLSGTFEAWPPTARWPTIGKSIHVRIGAPMNFAGTENSRKSWTEISSEVERGVRDLSPA